MINMKIFSFENEIEFDEDYVNVLEIEDRSMFKHIISELNQLINYNDENSEEIILIEGNKKLDFFNNTILIYDCFNINFNETKILKQLYSDIEKRYRTEYTEEDIQKYYNSILLNINKILFDYEFEFEYKETIEIKEILKAIGLRFSTQYYNKPLDNIIYLFDVVANFKLYKILIFVNIKCYFKEDELEELYKAAKYREINVLFIESQVDHKLNHLEKKLLVDEDFDEFIFKR